MRRLRFTELGLAVCFAISAAAGYGDAKSIKVIIDADPAIGLRFKDVDDGLMLLVALNSPELDILGITTTYGNASEKVAYEKTLELLELAGRMDIPVFRGAAKSDPEGTVTKASRFIADMAVTFPGEVTLLAVGPLTNVATALRSAPQATRYLKEIISMGGNVSAADVAATQCWTDLNYGSDKEAAGLILDSFDHLTVVSIQLSERFYISRTRYNRLVTETRNRDYLEKNTRLWYWMHRRAFVVWDLVALACLIHPEWFLPNNIPINYLTSVAGRPKIVETPDLRQFVSVNVPDFDGPQDSFWDWVFERL